MAKQCQEFELCQHVNKNIVHTLAFAGAWCLGRDLVATPLWGFFANFIRPRRNLVSRYSQWALVTGASDGIGKQLAIELAKSGVNIVLVARDQTKLNNVAAEIEKMNVKTRIVIYDFSKLQSTENIKELEGKLSEGTKDLDIGILVNNVGRAWFGKFHTQTHDMMFNMVQVNCISQMAMSRYFLDQWRVSRQGKKCAIIDVSSMCADSPSAMVSQYAATKAFNSLLSQSLYAEYQKPETQADQKVDLDVLTVYPHSVKTNMNSGRYTMTVTAE